MMTDTGFPFFDQGIFIVILRRSFYRGAIHHGSALAVGMLLFPSPSSGQIVGPLPPPSSRPTSCH